MKRKGFKSLKTKILLGFIVVLVLTAGLSTYMISLMLHTNEETKQMIEEEVPLLVVNEKLAINMHERTNLLNSFVFFESEGYREAFEAGLEESIALEEHALALSDSEQLDALLSLKVDWGTRTNQVFEMYDDGDVDQARRYLENQVAPVSVTLVEGFTELAANREARIEELGDTVLSTGEVMTYSSIVITLVIVVIGLVIAFIMSGMITKPIQRVTERMRLISEGKLDHELFETRLRDEAGQLMIATNEMNQQMHLLIRELNEVSDTVERHSDGLTQSAIEVSNGADQISITMGELADGSESQATHASDLSEGMQNLNNDMINALEKGHEANQETQAVITLTSDGQKLMKQSVQMMRDIDKIIKTSVDRVETLDQNAQNISRMVSVIQDIADQTNLLALNASIEAARAGEHGRGFSVVAEEVRKLAEQVSDSVNEITGTVDTIQSSSKEVTEELNNGYGRIKEGTTQIESTDMTFGQINQAVNKAAAGIEAIADTLAGVSSRSAQLLSNVEEVASISEESAAGVEQTSASVEEMNGSMVTIADGAKDLSGMVKNLKDIINRFEV